MRIGVGLPLFRTSPAPALAVADHAVEIGLDGVFVFDHLFPFVDDALQSGGPALSCFPMLAAVAARHPDLRVGTLVARVGIADNDVIERQFRTVAEIAGPRLIVGLGTGDAKSRPENDAYRIAFPPFVDRVTDLEDACVRLRAAGLTVWIGGRSDALRIVAERHGLTRNLWSPEPAELRSAIAGKVEVTWGGNLPGSSEEAERLVVRLDTMGVTWAIFLVPGSGDDPGSVRRLTSLMRRNV